MMKVFDMVAYGMHDPDEIAPPYSHETPHAIHANAVPSPQLQTLQYAPTSHTNTLPPSLRTVDIDHFLETCGD